MAKLLITGITGLIGRSVLKALCESKQDYQISAMVRPGTGVDRFAQFVGTVDIVELDLADTDGLRKYLQDNKYDMVVHIGALRGGRGYNRSIFLKTNLLATQQIVDYCQKVSATLLFCSSVGVFGAIPEELPANNESPMVPDNYYHYTKIECEKYINRAILNGLKAAILRPSITYGPGDNGFPRQMVHLVNKGIFPLINKRVWIHLCHIDTITAAFVWLVEHDFPNGLCLNIADREPVHLHSLIHFISRQLRNRNYRTILNLDRKFFRWGEILAKHLKNELWLSRFQLISRSWFYDVRPSYEIMELPVHFTIPDIQIVIKNYQGN